MELWFVLYFKDSGGPILKVQILITYAMYCRIADSEAAQYFPGLWAECHPFGVTLYIDSLVSFDMEPPDTSL